MDPAILLVAGLAVILLLQFMRVRRQQRDVRATRSALEVGAEVLTASGMIGTVVEATGATVVLAGEDGQRTRWVTGAVVRVLPDTDPVSSRYEVPGDLPGDAPGAADELLTDPASPGPSSDGVRPGVVDLGKAPRDGKSPRDSTGSGNSTGSDDDPGPRDDTAAGTTTKD